MTDANIDNLGFMVHDVARLLRRHFEARGREYGLSAAQWRAAVRLVKHGPMSQAKLAEVLEIEPISVSRLIDRMEQAGWAVRRPDENDRRANVVHPTDLAVEAFSKVKSMAGSIYETALDGLSQDERRTLIKALAAMTDNLARNEIAPEEAAPIKKQVTR
ncbi:MAG: MarR family transcriptional regulator [Rhizobiales bacterium]|nr:MarR family transcriptional regulator [Hyphomicrobiales bacterium]|tara:strand:+ start:342 stop:821 length:480 start_codon:yes stop_codon:yes gene_type:complete